MSEPCTERASIDPIPAYLPMSALGSSSVSAAMFASMILPAFRRKMTYNTHTTRYRN